MPYGFTNPKDLVRWNPEDSQKARECRWMLDRQYKEFEKKSDARKEAKWWYEKLYECLPTPELNEFDKKIKKLSILFDLSRFENVLRGARQDMVQKILALEYNKLKMLKKAQEASLNVDNYTTMSTFEQNNIKMLTRIYPKGSQQWQEQRDNKVNGYYPNMNVLLKLPPIEILDFAGFRLIKYDKLHGYFSAIISYPKDQKKPVEIIYDENPLVVESKSESLFDKLIDEHLQKNANPYGDKTFNEVDISNIQQAMNVGKSNDNPLDKDIF